MNRSVYLSPSMQETNVGFGMYGTEEKRMNEVADVAQRVLESHGVTVYRNNPQWSLAQIVTDSNIRKPDIHVAIHSNACNGKARGCEIFAYSSGGEDENLARSIYTEIELLTPTPDRGVKFWPELYELRNTIAPAALVEVAFHDNPEDAMWTIENIESIGTSLARGILNYLGIPLDNKVKELEEAVDVLCRNEVIQSPDYWLNNAVKGKTVNGEYAAILIQRTAALLLKGGM